MKKKAQEKSERKEKYRYRRTTIPYVKGLSEEIRREMIPVSLKPYKTIGQHLGHPKIQFKKKSRLEWYTKSSARIVMVNVSERQADN